MNKSDSDLDIDGKDAILAAALPDVPFDGWSRAGLLAAVRAAGLDGAEGAVLFPGGPRDLVAWFSHWADRRTLALLADRDLSTLKLSERVALAARTRLEVLAPHREAVRRALTLLALPVNLPLGLKLLYDTVDALWYAAGDEATDFSFYTKRGILAGVYAATSLYWLDDRSEDGVETDAFLARRLQEALALPRLGARFKSVAPNLPNPLRFFRTARRRA